MKLLKFRTASGESFGLLRNDGIVDLQRQGVPSLAHALARPDPAWLQRHPEHALDAVTLLPPLEPGAVLYCVGLNYKSHLSETGHDLPPEPALFIRTQASVVGHGQPLLRPRVSAQFDYEGELAVVIGRHCRAVPRSDAFDVIAGYTCFNDGSVRDFQKHSVSAGKNFDASGACGPWIVSADELGDPTQLTLVTRLNGKEVQCATTDLLIYPIAKLVEYVSTFAALNPGDIIATGTPAGVGAKRSPPLWMKAGDRVEVEISRIGTLTNEVEDA